MLQLVAANPHLPLCKEVLSLNNDIHVQSLLLMIVFDYAQYADSEQEGMSFFTIDHLYPEESECGFLRRKLRDGSHILIQRGYIEHKCDDGIADAERYRLTSHTKEHLLSAYSPSRSQCNIPSSKHRALKSFETIKQKELFFNASEQEQIDRLAELLSVDNLPSVQQRLEEEGMRKGFACLFYGAPGTGKTETVLQIARQTGRDIMQVDIAGMRDKWVGESEKNIKGVFTHYRKLCKTAKVMPILFFNEADALINKRTENVTHSVEKMDNAMQNIILQESIDLYEEDCTNNELNSEIYDDYIVDTPQERLLLQTIESTGDGMTPETAFCVIDVFQEYEFLDRVFPYNLLTVSRQRLLSKGIDCLEFNPNIFNVERIFFDVSRRFEVGYSNSENA